MSPMVGDGNSLCLGDRWLSGRTTCERQSYNSKAAACDDASETALQHYCEDQMLTFVPVASMGGSLTLAWNTSFGVNVAFQNVTTRML
jgi:hypothetical protein